VLSAITYRGFMCPGGIVPSSLDAMELVSGICGHFKKWCVDEVWDSSSSVPGLADHCCVMQAVSCKVPVVQSIFCLASRLEESYIFPSSSKFGTLFFWLHCLQGNLINLMFFDLVLSRIQGVLFHELLVLSELQFLHSRGSDGSYICWAFVDALHSSPSFTLLLDVL
jgi:hypothetical protein